MRFSYIPLRLSMVLALMITKQQQSSAKPIDCNDVCDEMEAMLGLSKGSNCIRLCDSVNESSKRASFMRIGRASFMRIGRGGTDSDNGENEQLARETRPYLYNIKRPSFMRIGKKSNAEKKASFMRIGKKNTYDNEMEKKASFMRIGKKASFMRIGKKSNPENAEQQLDGDKKAAFDGQWSRR